MESDWLCVFVFVWCGMTNTNCHTIDHFIIYFCVFVVSLANIFGFIQIQKLRLKFCVSAFHQSFASVFFFASAFIHHAPYMVWKETFVDCLYAIYINCFFFFCFFSFGPNISIFVYSIHELLFIGIRSEFGDRSKIDE